MVRSARLWGILAAALAAGATAPATAEPPRVMSIEACANQYVLALADREQIISLAKGADDPRTSFLHEKARGIPANQRSAEEVIAADPDLVFTGPFSRRTREFLQRFHIRIVRTKRPKTLGELSAQIRRVAGILGHPERGERLASSIDALAAGTASVPGGRRPTAVIYRGHGYSFGADTLADAIMSAAGIDNIAAKLGYKRGGYVPLEILLVGKPDYLLDDTVRNPMRPRIGAQIIRHPALDRSLGTSGRIEFPVAFWLCGGEATTVAIGALAGIARGPATPGANQ